MGWIGHQAPSIELFLMTSTNATLCLFACFSTIRQVLVLPSLPEKKTSPWSTLCSNSFFSIEFCRRSFSTLGMVGAPWPLCPPWPEMVPRICLHSERLQCPSCPPPPVSFLSMTNGPGPKHSPPRPQKPLFFTSPQTLFRSHHRKETRLSICQKCWTLYRCLLFSITITL